MPTADGTPASFAAFCRKHGTHRPYDGEQRNWNEEAVAAMAADMKTAWKDWVEGVRRRIYDELAGRLTAAATLDGTPLGEYIAKGVVARKHVPWCRKCRTDNAVALLEDTPQLGNLSVSVTTSRDEAVGKMERQWFDFEKGLEYSLSLLPVNEHQLTENTQRPPRPGLYRHRLIPHGRGADAGLPRLQ